jgi:mannitol-1-phosphate/altronate dehydrogenase
MNIPLINTVVRGAAMEMRDTCVLKLGVDEEFADFYFEKEIARFENTLLFDPISRIAREPFRKLALDNRLIGATALCLSAGVRPSNIVMGTIAAFHYNNPNDDDHHIRTLIKSLSREDFLQIAIGLHKNDVVYQLILENWERSREKIERLSNVRP